MNDLLQKLESYNWTDELGHPLVNCVEWIELKNRIKDLEDTLKIKRHFKIHECETRKSRGE